MGCGSSSVKGKEQLPQRLRRQQQEDEKVLRLATSKLLFPEQQQERLNIKFNRLALHGDKRDVLRARKIDSISAVVERLIQRLVCSVGHLDHRFSSKFLVDLDPFQDKVGAARGVTEGLIQTNLQLENPRKRLRFKYLVRLDAISTPALYPDLHQPFVKVVEGVDNQTLARGYCRLQLFGRDMEDWAEFIHPNGYLRRDKIQERFVQLLAAAAARPCSPHSPRDVDESRHCGSPGKVVDPITLHQILQQPPSRQLFYGPAQGNEARFPDPRDCRIVLVEGVPETRLHISFLSPTAQSLQAEEDIEVVLTLAVGVAGWPQCSDFPYRMPLDHVDVLLSYQAAQMGYFLVPQGPHQSQRCDDRTSAWEIRPLACEMMLDHHYTPNSTVGKVIAVLSGVLNILRARGVKTVTRHVIKTLLYWELESHAELLNWTPRALARRVLGVLDRLLLGLRKGCVPSYVIPSINLLLTETVLDEDWISDGDILEHYLKQLSREGVQCEEDKYGMTPQERLEEVMLYKWSDIMSSMCPAPSNRTTRLSAVNSSSVSISYTKRQMNYIAAVFREVLKLKHNQSRRPHEALLARKQFNLPRKHSFKAKAAECEEARSTMDDLVYLLQVMFDQAKLKLTTASKHTDLKRGCGRVRELLESYEVSTALLLDDLKRDVEEGFHLTDDTALVAKLLECMYKAIDSDSRVLAVVLRPFLTQLFQGSHYNGWFLHEWQARNDSVEMNAIGIFSELVLRGDIDPLEGIMDSVNKGWVWASSCLNTLQAISEETSAGIIIGDKLDSSGSGLRLMWTPEPGMTVRRVVCLPAPPLTLQRMHMEETGLYGTIQPSCGTSRYATIRSLSQGLAGESLGQHTDRNGSGMLYTVRKLHQGWSEKRPEHTKLRDSSPLTMVALSIRRQGTHRGLGSIIPALISLHKLTVLQEISQQLPESERVKVLGDLKKLSKEVQRLAVSNCRRRMSLPKETHRNRFSFRKAARCEKKAKSATLPGRLTHTTQQCETYRKTEQNMQELEERERKLKEREQELDEEMRRMKEDSLLGTCRLLRKQVRPCLTADSRAMQAPVRTGRLTVSRAAQNQSRTLETPFYIKVSSFQNRQISDI